jgi:uncharacterized protein YkwD
MRSRRRHRTVLLTAAIGTLALAAPAGARAADCPGADATPAEQGIRAASRATLCLLNAERSAKGLPALAANAVLARASQGYSELMLAKRFFAHETPRGADLVTRLGRAGYITDDLNDWSAGENLAWAEGSLATPRSVMTAWMGSPGHRANILSRDYAEVGVGIALGTPTEGLGATYTTDFGRRHAPSRRTRSAKAAAAKRAASARSARARARARQAARTRAARAARARAAHRRQLRKLRTARRAHRPVYRARFISG